MPLSAKETADIDVGGPTSDNLFEVLDHSIAVKLPERSCRAKSDVVSSEDFGTSQGASSHARSNTPGILGLLQSRHGVSNPGSVSAREPPTTTRARHWPLASDFFRHLDGAGSPDGGASSTTQQEHVVKEPVRDHPVADDEIMKVPVINDSVIKEPVVKEPVVHQHAVNESKMAPVTPPMTQNPFASVLNEPRGNEPALDSHVVDLAVMRKSRSSIESTSKPESHTVQFQDPISNPFPKHEQPSDVLGAAIDISRDAERTSDNHHVASQFLRGLVALIDQIRTEKPQPTGTPMPLTHPTHAGTHPVDSTQAVRRSAPQEPATPVSVFAPVPSTLHNNRHPGDNAQAVAKSTHQTLVSVQDTQDEQTRHLDALEAARQARLAMKDTFGDIMLADGTQDVPDAGSRPPSYGQQHDFGARQTDDHPQVQANVASWESTVALTKTLHNASSLAVARGGRQPAGPQFTYDTIMQALGLGSSASMPSIVPEDMSAGVPFLLESMTDGRIKLYLNGMETGCSRGRMLYRTGKSDHSDLREVGRAESNAKETLGVEDIVIERNLENYKVLVELYHFFKLRKAVLVKQWMRANPTRTHLLVPHAYVEDNDRHAPPPPYAKCPINIKIIDNTPAVHGEPGKIPSEEYNYSLISRRLLVMRGKNITDNLTYSPEKKPVYFGFPFAKTPDVKAHFQKTLKPEKMAHTYVLPESEEVYSRLAWFVRNVSEEAWLAGPASKKRPSETALEPPGLSKKKARKAPKTVQVPGTKANSVALGPARSSVLNQIPGSGTPSRSLAPTQQENHGLLVATADDWQAAQEGPSAETMVLKYTGTVVVLNEG